MTPARSGKVRVLVVDDDAEVQEMLREYLSLQGYEVLLAATSIGAMSMARMHRPDVVLLDLMMPGAITGDAIVGTLSRDVPVVVITAVADAAVARRTLRDGAFDFIAKPFQLNRLRAVVEAAVLHGRRNVRVAEPDRHLPEPIRPPAAPRGKIARSGGDELRESFDPRRWGRYLRVLRLERGWTQDQLGRRLGITNVTVSRLESGTRRPSVEMFQRMAGVFGMTTDELMQGGDP